MARVQLSRPAPTVTAGMLVLQQWFLFAAFDRHALYYTDCASMICTKGILRCLPHSPGQPFRAPLHSALPLSVGSSLQFNEDALKCLRKMYPSYLRKASRNVPSESLRSFGCLPLRIARWRVLHACQQFLLWLLLPMGKKINVKQEQVRQKTESRRTPMEFSKQCISAVCHAS